MTSCLTRLLEHLIKIDRRPGCESAPHWQAECYVFQTGACDAYTPSMRHLLEMARIWKRAQRLAAVTLLDDGGRPNPAVCPFRLDELLAEEFDVRQAVAQLAAARDGE